ncbi:hypothetical protein [Cytobacillus sp. FSL H8-0458]|uniref:hypothetical protein n=1 Tax=Cytobacillus sp. FSL H8-0458 TaxID=2975346 RepID=UPI0030FA10C6
MKRNASHDEGSDPEGVYPIWDKSCKHNRSSNYAAEVAPAILKRFANKKKVRAFLPEKIADYHPIK